MRVDVYRNLHKNKLSVKALEGDKKGRVINHVNSITIKDAKFVVQPSGRERVLKERKKNVHAFARGNRTRKQPRGSSKEVFYNPYKADHFYLEDGRKIETAKYVTIDIIGEKAIMKAYG